MKSFLSILHDLISLYKGKFVKKQINEYRYAFLVHSRGYKDIYRKYPQFKFLPKTIILFIMNKLWPITLSKVTGVYSTHSGKEIKGYVLGITMTADEMMKNKERALYKIRQALYLARGKGVKIMGLGGLTSSLSGGGTSLLDIDINITTGHAYTAYNVTQNLFKLVEIFQIPKEYLNIAVVGAAGSIGSMSSLIIARAGYTKLVLVDIKRKESFLLELLEQIKKINPSIDTQISFDVNDIKDCDYVITATNRPEALITTHNVSAGMVIIDDAQPSDVHPDVLKMDDVLVLEAGVVDTPGINSNFNYGLKSKHDNFCCMAELLILAANQWENHYVINRATLEHVDSISEMGYNLGFKLASFQNFMESISNKKIEHIKSLVQKKHAIH